VGKTTLAVHVAHRLVEQFPDGQLFVNLRGYGSGDPIDSSTALGAMLRAFGVPEREIPQEEDDRSKMVRSLLAGRRILMVLDNARDSFQVRPLLPGGFVAVLVTSRMQLRSLATREGAQRIHVEEMTLDEAVDLLQSRRSPQTQSDLWAESDVAELAHLCGHLPVALAVAAERANRYPDRPLSDLNAELRDGHAALDTLTAWEDDPATSVRAVLAWSFDALGADEARMFRLLGLHPYPALDVNVASALAALDVSDAERLLDRLVDCHLLTERLPGEYEMHDFVRAFAAHLATTQLDSSEIGDVVNRMRAMYVHSLGNAGSSFMGRPLRIPLPPLADNVTPITFDEPRQSRRWFNDNERRIRAVLDEASACADHRHALMLAVHMAFVLMEYGRTHDGLEMSQIAVAHARKSGDAHAEALCAFRLGVALRHAGDFAAALDQFTAAHQGYTRLGIEESALRALMATGVVLAELGRDDEATRVQEAAVANARNHDRVTSEMLNNLAMEFVKVGRAREALALAEEAVDVARREREALFEVGALDTTGLAYLQLGAPLQALQAFEQALKSERAWPNILQPYLLMNRGLALRALGRHDEARESWYRALGLMDELDVRDSNQIRRSELQELLNDTSDQRSVSRDGSA
jgi:tetratricopeptide (TPR) repeat protein